MAWVYERLDDGLFLFDDGLGLILLRLGQVEDVGEVAEHMITESKFAPHGSTMMMHTLRQSGGYPENDKQCRAGRENPKTTCFHNSS